MRELEKQIDKVIEEKFGEYSSYCVCKNEWCRCCETAKSGANLLKPALIRALEALENNKLKSDTVANPAITKSTVDMKNRLDSLYQESHEALAEIKESLGNK